MAMDSDSTRRDHSEGSNQFRLVIAKDFLNDIRLGVCGQTFEPDEQYALVGSSKSEETRSPKSLSAVTSTAPRLFACCKTASSEMLGLSSAT